MKRHPIPIALMLLLTFAPTLGPPTAASAGVETDVVAGDAAGLDDGVVGAGAGGAADSDSWMGPIAAVACGLFVRASVMTAGTQVGTLVGAVATCTFMVFDALLLDKR